MNPIESLIAIRNSTPEFRSIGSWKLDEDGCEAVVTLLSERGVSMPPGPVRSPYVIDEVATTDHSALDAAVSSLDMAGKKLANRLTPAEREGVANLVALGAGGSGPVLTNQEAYVARAFVERPGVLAISLRITDEIENPPPDWLVNGPSIGPATKTTPAYDIGKHATDDLKFLAGHTFSSVAYLIFRARGHDVSAAMKRARVVGPLEDMLNELAGVP